MSSYSTFSSNSAYQKQRASRVRKSFLREEDTQKEPYKTAEDFLDEVEYWDELVRENNFGEYYALQDYEE